MSKQGNKTNMQQYKDKLLHETFANRAKFIPGQENFTKQTCECCYDRIVFALSSNDAHFTVGISTILECLSVAEKEGAIPPIGSDWWIGVKNGICCKDDF